MRSWTKEELARLLAACDSFEGEFRGAIPQSNYARALVMTAYDTAARYDDLERWRFDDIGPDGSITFTERKWSKQRTAALAPETLAAVRLIQRPGAVLIFGSVLGRPNFHRWFRRLIHTAGLRGRFASLRAMRVHESLSPESV